MPPIATFAHYYEQLESGETGMLPDDDLDQLSDVPAYDDLPDEADREALDKAVIVKLNGGLGTSMGMEQAKSLLEVKEGGPSSTSSPAGARAARAHERAAAARAHELVLHARRHARGAGKHPELESDVPADFVQNKEPKLTVEDRVPIEWPDDPDLEWCPPGHGDVYTALKTLGDAGRAARARLRVRVHLQLRQPRRGARPARAELVRRRGLPFVMEVCEKTPADRKGGHPAVLKETGRLVLRETAQTPEEDLERFGDIDTWRYFNTNNLWVDLRALARRCWRRTTACSGCR